MRARLFRESDVAAIEAIWENNPDLAPYSLPSREFAIGDVVIEDEGKVIAYGQLQTFAIAHMFLDHTISVRKRRAAMAILLSEALIAASEADVKKIYTFIRDPEYARLVEKHFGFELIGNAGEMLIREV